MEPKRSVFPVHYVVAHNRLEVTVEGKRIPMDEFVQTYNPLQVTGFTQIEHGGTSLDVVGMVLAERVAPKAKAKATWGKSQTRSVTI